MSRAEVTEKRRAHGSDDAMRASAVCGAGVFAGDILVVDRSLRSSPRQLVALVVGGSL